jgi:hypothetical protein
MKKLLFIASVGLLFSCSNGAGTCVCTETLNGQTTTVEVYYEKDAQEYCDVNENNGQTLLEPSGGTYNCVVE